MGIADGTDWPSRLADAVALSAAAVAAPLAGSFDAELYRRLLGQVEVRELGRRRARRGAASKKVRIRRHASSADGWW